MYANKLALQNAILSEAIRSGDSTFEGLCGGFISRAEAKIFTGVNPLKCREMETRATLTVTAGAGATPANFLSARRLTWVTDRPYKLIFRHPEDFYDQTGANSRATIYTIDGTIINVLSPESGTAILSYYARPSALSGDTDTNAVLTAQGHVYLAAALVEAFGYLRDDQNTAKWMQKLNEAIDGANLAAVKARYSGTHLAPRIPGAI